MNESSPLPAPRSPLPAPPASPWKLELIVSSGTCARGIPSLLAASFTHRSTPRSPSARDV